MMALHPTTALHQADLSNDCLLTKCAPHYVDSSNGGQRRDKKISRVRFPTSAEQMCEVVCNIMPSSSMNQSERDIRWYSAEEFTSFKNTVRTISKKIRDRNGPCGSDSSFISHTQNSTSRIYYDIDGTCISDGCNRGLEFRMSLERQRNKIIAKKAVLEAQRRLKRKNLYDASRGIIPDRIDSDNRLAIVAAKFSLSARDVAIRTGMIDFITAYPLTSEPTYPQDPIPTVSDDESPLRKHSFSAESNHPNKRIRFA